MISSLLNTSYQKPYTLYQIPVYPLDKHSPNKRLKRKLGKKQTGLAAAIKGCGLIIQTSFKSVAGVRSVPGLGPNPLSNMARNGHMRCISNLTFKKNGKTLNDNPLIQIIPIQPCHKTLMISKKGRIEICQ